MDAHNFLSLVTMHQVDGGDGVEGEEQVAEAQAKAADNDVGIGSNED